MSAGFAFVGRYAIYNLDFTVLDADGLPATPDDLPVAEFRRFDNDELIFSRQAVSTADLGVYRLQLSSVETETPGLFFVRWAYELGGIPQAWRIDIEIPQAISSAYGALGPDARSIVDITWEARMSDMFDSAVGGPHLREYAQSNFGRDRMALLLGIGLNRLNTAAQPHTTFNMENFPYAGWGGLLEMQLWIETIRHLIRSYVEQPNAQGVQTVRLDRRDYFERWQAVLRDALEEIKDPLAIWKMSQMGLGRASVLVAGGIYREYEHRYPPTRPKFLPPVVGRY